PADVSRIGLSAVESVLNGEQGTGREQTNVPVPSAPSPEPSATTLTLSTSGSSGADSRARYEPEVRYYGEESRGIREVADHRGAGDAGATGWYGVGPAGHQHHGVREGVQRTNPEGSGDDSPRRDHHLLGQVV